jgi:hypothetical protein
MEYLKPILTLVGEAPAVVLGFVDPGTDGGSHYRNNPTEGLLGLDD